MKRILCGDLIPGCEFKAQARTDGEVLSVEIDHVREAHGVSITPQFLQRARDRILDIHPEASEDVSPQAARRG